jgi:antibiotic biosynthesis monooxygenase (ABM) superfamily enzyme
LITRVWRGWTSPENANAYQDFLLSELFPTLRSLPGFLGADVLRRDDGEHIAFMTLTRFASLEDVRGFATGDLDVPVIEPRAAELLARYEHRVEQFTTERFER